MGVHIVSVDCPGCGKVVWYNDGDPDDPTPTMEIDGYACPWCDVRWLDDRCESWITIGRNANLVDCQKTPNNAV